MLSIGSKPLLGNTHSELVIVYEPGLSSLNNGDRIISDSAKQYIEPILKWRNVAYVATHQPTTFRYRRGLYGNTIGFVLGTNLLQSASIFQQRNWKISIIDTLQVRNLILVGCGWKGYNAHIGGMHTQTLYKRLLSNEYLHSVRDNYTVKQLNKIGIYNVINTGCPTIWGLTHEHCDKIRKTKGEVVVVTISDYCKEPNSDAQLFSILLKNYRRIYVWPQGVGDYDYICSLGYGDRIKIIEPSLKSYDMFLSSHPEADYIGTRLHGGIRALQHGNRSIIISIDNRAHEMGSDFNLPIVDRDDWDKLATMAKSPFETRININQKEIDIFLKQLDSISKSIPQMKH